MGRHYGRKPTLREFEKNIISQRARKAGFTLNGLRYCLSFLGLNPHTMTYELYLQLLPYLNPINAEKFNTYTDGVQGPRTPPKTRYEQKSIAFQEEHAVNRLPEATNTR